MTLITNYTPIYKDFSKQVLKNALGSAKNMLNKSWGSLRGVTSSHCKICSVPLKRLADPQSYMKFLSRSSCFLFAEKRKQNIYSFFRTWLVGLHHPKIACSDPFNVLKTFACPRYVIQMFNSNQTEQPELKFQKIYAGITINHTQCVNYFVYFEIRDHVLLIIRFCVISLTSYVSYVEFLFKKP